MSGPNAISTHSTQRRRAGSRALGTAVVAVLVADIAVAIAGGTASHHHLHGAASLRPLADVAPAPVIAQPVARSSAPSAAHRAAARRIAAALAAQTAQRQAQHAAATPTIMPSGRHVSTTTHTVHSDATTPGVKPDEVGTMTSGELVTGSAPKRDLAKIPKLTYLATMRHAAPGFSSATAKHKSMTVPRNWYGRTSVLPIVNATTKRVEVRLSRRPNESTTWIRLSAVNLGYSQQAILIDISERRLYVFRNGKQKYSFPVGLGRPRHRRRSVPTSWRSMRRRTVRSTAP